MSTNSASYPAEFGGSFTGSVTVTNFPAIQAVSGTVTVVQPSGLNLHVDIDNFPVTQNVNITQVGGTPLTLGQKVSASSIPVVIASDQSPIAVTGTISTSPNVNLHDGAGNSITSQASGAQRALDVGIDVAGVQIDPRQIRALSSGTDSVSVTGSVAVTNFPATQPVSGTVTALQGTSPWVTSGTSTVSGTVAVTQSTSPWVVSGSVTANAGTNLNTSALALDTSVNSLLKPASTLAAVTSITNTVTIKADTAANQPNALKVDGSATTQPISGTVTANQGGTWTTGRTWTLASGTDSVAAVQSGTWNINNISGTVSLPTGASTSALQTTGNSSLSSIDGKLNSLGQKTMAASVPVVIASDQSTIPVSGTITTSPNVNIHDAAGNNLTSQANGAQRALDVGIDVAGVQVDPRAASPGTITDRSGTATTTASTMMASNTSRKFLFIQNTSGGTIWFNFTTTAVSAVPSIRLQNGDSFSSSGSYISTEAISVISASGSRDYTAKEG